LREASSAGAAVWRYVTPGEWATAARAGHRRLVALDLPQQLGQPCDVRRDAPRLVGRKHLRLSRFVFVVPRVEVRERLAVRVADDVAAGDLVGVLGGREAAGWVGHALFSLRNRAHHSIQHDGSQDADNQTAD
jgi:hypothetical protein